MASNVFGNPITDATLEGMPEYVGKTITQTDRAHVAFNMKNANGKDVNVRRYVENLKSAWGNTVCTLCMIYNATGDNLTFITSHNWFGSIGPAPYPTVIRNGQWGGFLHGKKGASPRSNAAIVYRGKNGDGNNRDWMMCWKNYWRPALNNTVYTEIRSVGSFNSNSWNDISNRLDNSGFSNNFTSSGCYSTLTIGNGKHPVLEGLMMLASDAPRAQLDEFAVEEEGMKSY